MKTPNNLLRRFKLSLPPTKPLLQRKTLSDRLCDLKSLHEVPAINKRLEKTNH